MLGSIIGGIIGAAGSLLGGEKASDEAAHQQFINNQLQREFAQNSIRWRVEDAKAAGLHPLFALGGAGATFQPSPIVTPIGESFAQAGQHLGRAAMAASSSSEREAVNASILAARAAAQKDIAIAGYYDSERARNLQSIGPALPGGEANVVAPGVDVFRLPSQHQVAGVPIPAEAALASPGAFGVQPPLWKRYVLEEKGGPGGPNIYIDLPAGSSASESLESVSESKALMAAVVARNLQQFGDSWYEDFSRLMGHLIPR